jgi:hypothetical protein
MQPVNLRFIHVIRNPYDPISIMMVRGKLGLEPTPDYLKACASILHKSPERSRHLVKWETDWVKHVKNRMAEYDFLADYSFDD